MVLKNPYRTIARIIILKKQFKNCINLKINIKAKLVANLLIENYKHFNPTTINPIYTLAISINPCTHLHGSPYLLNTCDTILPSHLLFFIVAQKDLRTTKNNRPNAIKFILLKFEFYHALIP